MSARLLSRAVALLFLCAAPFLARPAIADDPAPGVTPAVAAAGVTHDKPADPGTATPAAPAGDGAGDAQPASTGGSGAKASAGKATGAKVSSGGAKKSKAKKRRGGINPCMTPDPGFGKYDGWSRAVSMGQMIAPKSGGIRKDGGFDVIIHFHGHEPVRKEFVKTSNGVVLVGIDLGIGSGAYSAGFASPQTFTKLKASIEAEMKKRTGNDKAHIRKLGLSSWSAGYGAIDQILRQTGGKDIDAVILLDSLHAGYVDESAKTLKTVQIEPFVAFAKRAASKKTFMFMSHSSIIPPGYASTTEVASYVVGKIGGKTKKAKRQDVLGLDMVLRFDKGNFHVRGYEGDDKPDHCAHLGLMAGIMKTHILPRWKTPQTKVASPKQAPGVKTPSKKDKASPSKGDKPSAKSDKPSAKDDKKAAPKKDDKKATPKKAEKSAKPGVKKVASKNDDKKKKPKKKK